jgi:RNA polymerase sigma-70 factor (ECF subfamily)
MAYLMESAGGPTLSTELLRRFQEGDHEALDRLWQRYLPRLRRWAHGRLPAPARSALSTDDLIQDAFVRSLARLRVLVPEPGGNLFGYFRVIVLNLVRDQARQIRRRPTAEPLDADEFQHGGPSPLESVIGRQILVRYEAAVAMLSEADQQLIAAFVELRCTDRELAELFDKPTPSAARVARARALGRLARAMATVQGTSAPSSGRPRP